MLCLGACALCGCGRDRTASEAVSDVDIDLSTLNTNIAFAQISAMYTEPWNYIGKAIRVKGTLDAYTDETGEEHSMVMVADAAACCAQGIEFVWKSGGGYADEYTGLGEAVIVTGHFELYQEEGYSRIRLLDADVEWNRL